MEEVMAAIEIVLIVAGIICVIVSIVMDIGSDDKEPNSISTELTQEQENRIKQQIEKIIDEQIGGVTERTEASLDKISNTKILEMNDYAESVLGEINRNHNETVFLYDMLNEKAKEIKTTVKDVNNTKRQVEKIHAEVVTAADDAVVNEPDRTDDGGEPAYEKADKSDKDTKDIAKERLVALVKKSNEKAGAKEGSVGRNSQADNLANKVLEDSKDINKEEKINKEQENVADVTEPVKKTSAKSPAAKNSTTNNSAGKNSTGKNMSGKTASRKKTASGASQNKENPTIQLEPGMTNNEKILLLNDNGMAVKDIAKQLNLGVGEVKLVIDLYKGGN